MRPHGSIDDEGMSVVEMLLACALFVVLTTIVAAIAIVGLRTTSGMEARLDNSSQANVGMAAASKILRTAVLPDQLDSQTCTTCADTAIVRATSTLITFYANLNNSGQGPSLVTLEVLRDPSSPDSAILRQTRIPPAPVAGGGYSFCDPTSADCHPEVRTLARDLIWPTPAIFGYYDFNGAQIAGTTLTSDNLPRVSSIDVSITVQTRPERPDYPSATLVQRVRLPNADINLLVQPS